jgi:hypothetical protein
VEAGHVKALRIALGSLALLLALVAVLVAVDVGRWRDRLNAGDQAMRRNPAEQVRWTPSTLTPFDPARRLAGLSDDIRLRQAIRAYAVAERTPFGFDNGEHRSANRNVAQGALEDVILNGTATEVAQADVLLGVLAFGKTSAPTGVTAPGERSVEAFGEAARLDPASLAAKFDLEVVLRALSPKGTRPGSNPSTGGTGAGRRGAGAGLSGSGF